MGSSPIFKPGMPRERVLKGAVILIGNSDSETSCLVRNMHAEGAELELLDGVELSKEFLLYLPFERRGHKAVARWRNGKRAGIQFTPEEPELA
ncbi:MAG TPA: PilZ domain-containing protein [Mesorhizobium sp.]|jgi:hypothetical protein|nr:PilZ domain-containing protein [Mesorhizobium sp.]